MRRAAEGEAPPTATGGVAMRERVPRKADPQPWSFVVFWIMPLASSVLFLVLTAFSFLHQPFDDATWQAMVASGGTIEDGVPSYEQADRNFYRGYKLAIWSFVTIAEALLLRAKRGRKELFRPWQPHLAYTQALFNLYRIVLAQVELFLLLFVPQDVPWVNPGLGIYGWSCSFTAGFPSRYDFTDLVHVGLAICGAFGLHVAYCLPQDRCQHGPEAILLRFLAAVGLGFAFWYPIYDSKHWSGSSHLANFGGEFLPIFALFSAVLERQRELHDQRRGPRSHKDWRFARWLDIFQVIMLAIAMVKFAIDIVRTTRIWGRPSSQPSGKVPAELSLMLGSFNLSEAWKDLVVFGINLGGMILLYVISEIMLWLQPYDEAEAPASTSSASESGMEGTNPTLEGALDLE